MKIVHICPYEYHLSGGHSNAIRALAEGQSALGADVTVLSCGVVKEGEESKNGVSIVRYLSAGDIGEHLLMCSSRDNLVVSFCGVRKIDRQAARICRKNRIKYVFSSGGALHFHTKYIWWKKALFVNGVTRYFRGASGLIATTEFERNRFRKLLPCYRGESRVIPNIIELPSALPSRRDDEENDFIFGFMGRLDVLHKGLNLLISAFAGLPSGTNSKLVLVGPDHDGGKAALALLTKQHGVEDRVEIRDPAYGKDKELFFAEIDCFVSLSRWEAFGISFVEAMSRGVASILSDRVNLKMEIQRNKAAALVPLNTDQITKEMIHMMGDRSYRMAISESGKKWASTAFQQRMVAKDSLGFYKKLK